jgi:TetR/AcrR family transcriptional repressor of nem operon
MPAVNPSESSETKRKALLQDVAGGTPERILDVAERLVQTRGFNGISYADIAVELGITKASLHYHFPSKAALGLNLITRYQETFLRALASIDSSHAGPKKKLREYVRVYETVLEQGRMCLCGMLAAEHATLPPEMRAQLSAFFDTNESWLVGVLESGRKFGVLSFEGPAIAKARMLVGALEGAMLLARSYGEVARFTQVATQLLSALSAGKSLPARSRVGSSRSRARETPGS